MWRVVQPVLIRVFSSRFATVSVLLVFSGLGLLGFWPQSKWLGCVWLFFPLLLYFLLSSPLGLRLAEKGLTFWLVRDTGEKGEWARGCFLDY